MTDLESLIVGDASRFESAADGRPARVQLGVLGPLVVRTSDGELRPRASRQRRLLTILAVHAGHDRPVTVDEMVEGLYGADASGRSRHSLATELWRARQAVGAAAIVTDADGYRLDLEQCDVDALEFEDRLTTARSALRVGEYERAERELRSALALWRGDPLPDWHTSAVGRAAAGRLTELYAGGRIDHAEALAGVGRRDEAVHLLDTVTTAEPTREHAWALLVELTAAMGNDRAARRALDTARRMLAEYGVELGEELDAARRNIGVAERSPIAAPPPARPTRHPVVGRLDEVAALDAFVRDALASRRFRSALVSGEAGIGKTTVVEHVLEDLLATGLEPTVVRVHCDRRSDLPYEPIVQALRSLGTDTAPDGVLAPLLNDPLLARASAAQAATEAGRASAAGRSVLHDAMADAIENDAATKNGLVLLVEDIHWAPESTLEVLARLAVRRADVPLAVLLTAREPSGATAATTTAIAELRKQAHTAIVLSGLDTASTSALLGPSLDTAEVDRLRRATGGNPLYLRHLRDASGADAGRRIPSLDDAVDDHLSAVTAPTAAVLAAAAVIGTEVDIRLLAATGARASAPISPVIVVEAVDEAIRAGLLYRRPDDDAVSWVHEVICARLYANTPVSTRAALHVAVAEASERLVGASPISVDLIAHHYAAGWPHSSTEVTVSRLARAGDHAAAQLDFQAAARYYRRAGDLLGVDHADAERHAELLEAEGNAMIAAAGLHDADEAEADLDSARNVFTTLGTIEGPGAETHRLRSHLGIARAHALHRVDEFVLDEIAGGVSALIEADGQDPGTAHSPLIGEGLTMLRTYRPSRATELLVRAVAADPAASGRLHAEAWAQQPVTERLATARHLVQDATADPVAAWIRLWVSEVAAGRRAVDDAPPGRPESGTGEERSWWEVRAWEITAAIAGGRFARAERLLTAATRNVAACRAAPEIATRASAIAGQRIRLLLLRSPSGSIADLEPPAGMWTTSHPVISHPVIRSWAAYMAALTGQTDLAAAACDDLIEQHLDGIVPEADLLPWACGTATAAIASGHRRAIDLMREVLPPHSGHFAIHTFTAFWGSVDDYLGRLALAVDEPEEAVERFDRAAVQYRHANARAYEPRALYGLARAEWRSGGSARADATAHWHESVALLDELGIDAAGVGPWPPA